VFVNHHDFNQFSVMVRPAGLTAGSAHDDILQAQEGIAQHGLSITKRFVASKTGALIAGEEVENYAKSIAIYVSEKHF
jgi:hypothetical protein